MLLVLLLISCGQQTSKKIQHTEENKHSEKDEYLEENVEEVKDSTLFSIGYDDDGAKLHSLEAIPIMEEEYLACDTSYQKLLKKKIKENKQQFYLNINNAEIAFQKDTMEIHNGGESWYEYIGYYSDLNMYAIFDVSVSGDLNTFSDFMLIDPETGYKYVLLPLGDAFGEPPLLSPDNNYFLDYFLDYYSGNNVSTIRIFKISDKKTPSSYITRYAEQSDFPFFIENLIWKSDSEIFIKAYKNVSDDNGSHKEYEYYKILLEGKNKNK